MFKCRNGTKVLNDMPMKYGRGSNANKLVLDYKYMVNMCIDIEYKNKIYNNVKILDSYKKNNKYYLVVEYNNKITHIGGGDFIHGSFGVVLGLKKYGHIYNINDIVNDIIIKKCGYIYYNGRKKDKAYQIKCTKCGFDGEKHYKNGKLVEEYWIPETSLKKGMSCPCCCSSPKIVVQGINDMYTTDRWMVELGVDEGFAKTHTKGSNVKAPCKCPHCGNETQQLCSRIYANKSITCSCGDGYSYPEKFMYDVLRQLNIEFETEYSPNWIKPRRYDFYISSLNMIIETHGMQHYKDSSGVYKKTLIEEQENDKYKKYQARDNGIKSYIVIDCRTSDPEFIKKNIVNSKLNEVFDLSKIDWSGCDIYSLKNIAKEVCDYWNNKEEWETTRNVASEFKIGIKVVQKYLKHGTNLGWCSYNAKDESSKMMLRNSRPHSKPVEIFKDGVSLGVFESAYELSRQSEYIFNVKLLSSKISDVCRGYRRQYKGFAIRFA